MKQRKIYNKIKKCKIIGVIYMKSHIKLRDKIIFVILIITILGNFMFSKPVQANLLTDFGGTLLDSLSTFVIALRRCNFRYVTKNFLY